MELDIFKQFYSDEDTSQFLEENKDSSAQKGHCLVLELVSFGFQYTLIIKQLVSAAQGNTM